ncbi:sucrose-phosphate phosphatase [Candidatus Cyanaurora vandensis]|uniref:sucrose-phosphate phosphatase n=1 Tax=Candidatus Cyanaurora vandensis TaxID=2714958 RepID=UPI00257D66BD|nr:sucrose-phosphate phosphatase [Candidatus Cyanaurora vandensis]
MILLVTDLDHTLVGDDQATAAFNSWVKSQGEQVKLVYATGRSLTSAQGLQREKTLLEPDYWAVSVGTEIYHQGELDLTWAAQLDQGWDRARVVQITTQFPQLKLQLATEQRPWKVSFTLVPGDADWIMGELTAQFQSSRLAAQLIYSSDRDLDILPKQGHKGHAVTYLQNLRQVPAEQTVVCGDSGNDLSMFQTSARGIVVGNAQLELRQWVQTADQHRHYLAKQSHAWGILEGLAYFYPSHFPPQNSPFQAPKQVGGLNRSSLYRFSN